MSLAGLLLVFCGFLFSQADSFPSTTDDAVIGRYKLAARIGVIPILACLAVAFFSVLWLHEPSEWAFKFTWVGFLALLIATGSYGAYTILREL